MMAWITLPNGGSTVELGVTDDRLAVIASRQLPADASHEAWDSALVALGFCRMSDWLPSSSGFRCRAARL
ncbi:MAG: hypothetical protein ACRD0W_01025 [Acidimicrobiales bacterium]